MKIFTTEDLRAIDRKTIEADGVSSRELIGRVAEGVAREITSRWRPTKRVAIFAGPGNNGADALIVAKLLQTQGFRPDVYLFNIGGKRLSSDCEACRDELLQVGGVQFTEVITTFDLPVLSPSWVVVDGLFGSGLSSPLAGGFVSLVRYINESRATVISIDVPSGLFGEWNPQSINRNIIHASLTLAIESPRLSFLLGDNAELVGEWRVLDIGLNQEALRTTPSKYHLVEESDVRRLLVPRPEFASKADFGNALIIAGSYGMMGAAVLAAKGALRAGAGKVSVYSARCGFYVMQTAVPEAMFIPDKHDIVVTNINTDRQFTAVGIGPGLGTHDATVNAVDTFIKQNDKHPLVIDADALNCLARRRDTLGHLPPLSILTPHAGEFDRLFDQFTSDEKRLLKAVEVAQTYNVLLLLKGRYTALVRPDGKIYFNSSGSPAMATPGSGDVLTGVLTALLAQGYKPEVAALIGMYVHGLAGDLAAETQGQYGVTATDIASNVGKAIKFLMK